MLSQLNLDNRTKEEEAIFRIRQYEPFEGYRSFLVDTRFQGG